MWSEEIQFQYQQDHTESQSKSPGVGVVAILCHGTPVVVQGELTILATGADQQTLSDQNHARGAALNNEYHYL